MSRRRQTEPREPRPPHVHRYDPDSGWCSCGHRDDGRLVGIRGAVYRAGAQEQDDATA